MKKEYSLHYFSSELKKDLWVAGMSAIGPYTTANPQEALRFGSKHEATLHPAWVYPLMILDIVEAPKP